MKRTVFIAFLLIFFCLSCVKNESRLPGSAPPGNVQGDQDTFRPLPGDENIKNSEVAYNLALEHAGGRNMQAAHHYVDLAIKLEPHAKYSYTKGVFYIGEKRFDKALFWLDRSMRENPGELQARLDILNAQGFTLMQLKRYEEAKEKFREIVNTEGMVSKFNAYYNLGTIYLEEKNLVDAESVLKKAVEENPNEYRGYMKLGRIAMERQDYLSAYGDYQKAAELVEPIYSSLQTDGPEIFYYLGETLLRQNRVEEARNAFLKVIKVAPEGAYGNKAKELLSKMPVN